MILFVLDMLMLHTIDDTWFVGRRLRCRLGDRVGNMLGNRLGNKLGQIHRLGYNLCSGLEIEIRF